MGVVPPMTSTFRPFHFTSFINIKKIISYFNHILQVKPVKWDREHAKWVERVASHPKCIYKAFIPVVLCIRLVPYLLNYQSGKRLNFDRRKAHPWIVNKLDDANRCRYHIFWFVHVIHWKILFQNLHNGIG